MLKSFYRASALLFLIAATVQAGAQLSLSTAVDLAQRNSPKVKMGEADVARARASLGVSKDAFVPSIATTGGYGRSTGAPLGVPVIFSISAQSLIFNFSQLDYIRSAHAGLLAAEHSLAEAKLEVTEDTTNTYLSLDNAFKRRDALEQAAGITDRLIEVIEQRLSAGVDPQIDLTRAKITAAQIRLQRLTLKDEISASTQHLAGLTGIGATTLTTDSRSIPAFAPLPQQSPAAKTSSYSEGVAAAYAIAKARQLTAKGDRRYLFLPQVSLQANYSRVDTGISSYLAYYPRFNGPPGGPTNSNNALGFGAALTIPLLDFAHRSHARESAADAAHALADAHQQESNFLEGRAKLTNSTLELDARLELAHLNQELAQNQLETVRVQMEPGSAPPVNGFAISPRDELNAELQERMKYIDVLNAELQLQQTRINLLTQQGDLGSFVHQAISATPTTSQPAPAAQQIVPGVPPAGTPPVPGAGVPGGSVPNPTPVPSPAVPHPQP